MMPQLSLYIDEKTLHKIETAAQLEHVSISKYVVRKLNESMFNAWPDNFKKLYGSIDDDSFKVTREKAGKIIGPNDLIIASTVLENDGILVTHNVNEFERVENLRIEDWSGVP